MIGRADIDLSRGHKEFDSKVKNLKGIFEKLKDILDISSYKEELQHIEKDAKENPSFQSSMPFEGMQLDYESYIYDDYIKRLSILTKKVEEEAYPFYEVHLLTCKIQDGLTHLGEDSIGIVIENALKLLSSINCINTHNQDRQNQVIQKAYEALYMVVLTEEIFDRSDLLDQIHKLNISANRENIGRFVTRDLKKVSSSDVVNEDLKHLSKEGLGYDYLSREFVQKMTRSVIGEKNEEYQRRKEIAYQDLKNDAVLLTRDKKFTLQELEERKKSVKGLNVKKNALKTRILSMVLVPTVLCVSGHLIGRHQSNKITEYKTITRTIDANSGNVIGDVSSVYDEHVTTYVATVAEYSPWRKNPNGLGYVRNAITYEYHLPDNTPDDYHLSLDDIDGNVREKYRFIESKDVLNSNDSTTDTTIYITETYQDKTDTRKSTKYIIPFTIGGGVLGLILVLVLKLTGIVDPRRIQNMIDSLNREIESEKLDEEDVRKRLEELIQETTSLRERYQEIIRKYGKVDEKELMEDDSSSWVFQESTMKQAK